jgi:CheY-like chemotaxis protein
MSEVLVLLVEDNPDDEKLALRALSQGKIDSLTMVVRDGQEALDYLFYEGEFTNRERVNPQVILLDLKLPKVDGLEVLKRIRGSDSTKLIPVVILTSSNEEKDIVASYGNGANSYIVKPVDMEKFTEAIHQFILYWVGLNKGLE